MDWDYSSWMERKRNIYLFRDTDHTSARIQRSLLSEIERLACNGSLSVIVVEGIIGTFPVQFAPGQLPRDLENALERAAGNSRWEQMRLLAYRCRQPIASRQFSISGAENSFLLTEHRKIRSRIHELGRKWVEEGLTDTEKIESSYLMNRGEPFFVNKRSRFAVDLIFRMEQPSSGHIGLLYGDGHYSEIIDGLTEQGIGYCTFFPGEPDDRVAKLKEMRKKLSNP